MGVLKYSNFTWRTLLFCSALHYIYTKSIIHALWLDIPCFALTIVFEDGGKCLKMDTRLTCLPSSSAFSLPGAWPSIDSLEETLSLPNANPRNEEPQYIVPDISRTEGIKHRCAVERSLRDSVATYDDDSDDFYSFIEAQEVQQICVVSYHMLTFLPGGRYGGAVDPRSWRPLGRMF